MRQRSQRHGMLGVNEHDRAHRHHNCSHRSRAFQHGQPPILGAKLGVNIVNLARTGTQAAGFPAAPATGSWQTRGMHGGQALSEMENNGLYTRLSLLTRPMPHDVSSFVQDVQGGASVPPQANFQERLGSICAAKAYASPLYQPTNMRSSPYLHRKLLPQLL